MAKDKKLTKSNDRVLSGVLGGVSEYFDLDASLVRLIFAAATIFTGFFPFVFIYIVAVIIMPDSPNTHQYKYRFDEDAEEKRRDVTPDEDDQI
jgi:phage shock protein C